MTGIMCALAGISSSSGSGDLYSFTSFTFSNAGNTGYSGPALSGCLSAYGTTIYPWLTDTSFFNVISGKQLWTVPASGQYRFTAKGASGGRGYQKPGGLAGQVSAIFTLTKGEMIQILAGQVGGDGIGATCGGDGGGGGGTFVVRSSTGDPLVVAGGGGGAASNTANQAETKDAIYVSSGRNGGGGPPYGGTGGANGMGGTYNTGSCVPVGSTGAGMSGDGQGSGPVNALSYTNGGTGGYITNNPTPWARFGGFGGGGSSGTNYCGGGGGGYSGGGGGGIAVCNCTYMSSGGAGGSYSANPVYTFAQLTSPGPGSVLVEKL